MTGGSSILVPFKILFLSTLSEEKKWSELQNDREVILEAVKKNGLYLEFASSELRNNKEVVLQAVKQNGYSFQYASLELRKDKEFVLEAVKQSGYTLQYASSELRNNKEVVIEAVKKYGLLLQHASLELRNDKEIVLEAVKQSGSSLEYSSSELRNDMEVVLEAVKQNGISLRYASLELRNDKEVVLQALKKDYSSLYYSEVVVNLSFAKEVVSFDGLFLKFLPEEYRRKKEVVLLAVLNNSKSLNFADEELQCDSDFLSEIEVVKKISKDYQKKIQSLEKSNQQLEGKNQQLEGENYFLKQQSEVEIFLKKNELEYFLFLDPSFHFCLKKFVDFNQKIDQELFHEKQGRDCSYKSFSFRKNEVDPFCETVFWNPETDTRIIRIIKGVKSTILSSWQMCYQNTKKLKQGEISKDFHVIIGKLMNIVSLFFGGIKNNKEVDYKCTAFVENIRNTAVQRQKDGKEGMSTSIPLSRFVGRGVCRHRSILFKILCDSLSIRCRLMRGDYLNKGKKEAHVWNYVYLNEKLFLVDCFNPSFFMNKDQPIMIDEDHVQYSKYLSLKRKIIEAIKKSPPLLLNKYLINKEGKFGDVYKIQITNFPQKEEEEEEENEGENEEQEGGVNEAFVAIKKNKSQKRVFQKECKLMGLMNHSNVIPFYGNYEYDDGLGGKIQCLVMKYFQENGKQFFLKLGQPLKISRLGSIDKTINFLIFLIGVSKGLRYLHSLDIIHFDLKLSNVVCGWKNDYILEDVCLIDFGGSKEKFSDGLSSSTFPIFNMNYASPELIKVFKDAMPPKRDSSGLKDITFHADIYSLGKIMKSEFMGKYEDDIPREERLNKKEFNYLEGLLQLESIVEKCLSEEKIHRPECLDLHECHIVSESEKKKKIK